MLTNEQKEKLNTLCRSAFESLVGQIIIDKEGTILYFSKEHTAFLGIEKDEAEGKNVCDIIPNTRMHIVIETGVPEVGTIFKMIHRVTNKTKYMICNRTPIVDNKGEIIGAMAETVFSRGIEDIYRLNDEVLKHGNVGLFANEKDYWKNLQSFKGAPSDGSSSTERSVTNIIGVSDQIGKMRQLIAKIADLPAPVLITGETGTGKEVFSDALHMSSLLRRDKNFVKINCAAIPNELLESELFGYEKGAFSGANSNGKIGKFEYAGNGTVLLDEIGDMPMELQAKLLRVLQQKEFERIGGVKTIPFNARVVCTTNRNVINLIKEGKFREDLYYRINVLELYIPPLREHKADIDVLSRAFINDINVEYGLSISSMSDEVKELLNSYEWPGNVRELRHVIERACMMKGTGTLTLEDLSFFMTRAVGNSDNVEEKFLPFNSLDLKRVKMDAEKDAIKKALKITDGNKVAAAKLLGIERTVLYDKIKKYDMQEGSLNIK